MTDDLTLNQPKRDDAKKSTSTPSVPRGSKRTPSSARPSSAAGNLPGASRPSSRTGNKKPVTPAAGGTESGSESSKKPTEAKKSDLPRNKSQGGTGQRNGNQRNRQPSSSQANRSIATKDRISMGQSSSPAPASASESSDALSSLQRVIADLKTTPSQVSPNNSLAASMHAPQVPGSNLPVNAPVFHPGASAFPPSALSEIARHRKAASLGASALSGNFNSFSPHLGAMIEDAEDGTGASFEDGEISETFFPNSGHQARSQSQSFMAPRFAALAAQQEQDVLGPTGRPQLAPNFMFGARRRTSSNVPMGPLNEEGVGFQFPQQQSVASEGIIHDQNHRRGENDITGIMAEQVCVVRSAILIFTHPFQIAIQSQIEALQQQQQALYQQQLASNQVLSLQTPGLVPNRHRRVQSTLPVSIGGNNSVAGFTPPMGQFSSMANLGVSPDSQPAGLPRGHGRRHSVNVVNKSNTSQGNTGSVSFPYSGQDAFEDGFASPFGNHSRSTSRVDSSWRISVYQVLLNHTLLTCLIQMVA